MQQGIFFQIATGVTLISVTELRDEVHAGSIQFTFILQKRFPSMWNYFYLLNHKKERNY